MAGRQKKTDKDIDPEVAMRLKFLRKCRFRAIGRMVMANTYWMIEAAEEYEGVEDVKRRVAQAVRGKAKKKRLLSITDKALLNKPAMDRTESEKKYIYRIIGGLKCFKRYPNHVKKKLAAVTYFKYYGPGRVIVRQHQEAHAMYFIVTGDVIVSHMIFDELLQRDVSVDLGVMHAGDMFGEVSLLHNIPRTATCTTVDHCELLILMKEDFKNVLQASIQKQWDEVRRAMSAFTYFDALDEVARREGCIVAKMKSYAENDIILGDGMGVPNFVYFILSGRCQMIEKLQVIPRHRLGRTSYTLYDPYIPKEESEQDLDTKYFAGYKNLKSNASSVVTSKTSRRENSNSSIKPDISANVCTQTQKARGSILKLPNDVSNLATHRSSKRNSIQIVLKEPDTISRHQSLQAVSGSVCYENLQTTQEVKEIVDTEHPEHDILVPIKENEDARFSIDSTKVPPPNMQTYFMQVCQFNPGSSFGFGENMRDRRIVALTPVDCMLLPKIWLLQRNTANIWSRIEHYLHKKIPSKKQLFKEFVAERRWQQFRDELVEDVVARSNTVNWTSVHDVPYSIRMEEMIDI